MIELVKMYTAFCDECGRQYSRMVDSNDKTLKGDLELNGWAVEHWMVFCPDCIGNFKAELSRKVEE